MVDWIVKCVSSVKRAASGNGSSSKRWTLLDDATMRRCDAACCSCCRPLFVGLRQTPFHVQVESISADGSVAAASQMFGKIISERRWRKERAKNYAECFGCLPIQSERSSTLCKCISVCVCSITQKKGSDRRKSTSSSNSSSGRRDATQATFGGSMFDVRSVSVTGAAMSTVASADTLRFFLLCALFCTFSTFCCCFHTFYQSRRSRRWRRRS